MSFHAPHWLSPSDESSALPSAAKVRALNSDDPALALLARDLTAELHALKAGVPGACRRFESVASRCVERLASDGMPADRALARMKQMIYGHVPWEPFRDPSHIDRLAGPIITACVDSWYALRR